MEEAWSAYRAGSQPVGAVITDAAGKILTRGRNRIFETTAPAHALVGSRVAHAEMNALAALNHGAPSSSSILYTTLEPCPMCASAIRICHVGEVRYATPDPIAGSLDLLVATPTMRRHPVRVADARDAKLKVAVVALLLAARWNELPWQIDTWNVVCPEGVSVARALVERQYLSPLHDAGAGAEVVFDEISAVHRELLEDE